MASRHFVAVLLSGTVISGFWGYGAMAADVGPASLPAVSAFNGKIEVGSGFADVDFFGDDELFYGAASFSLPLGDMFGLQADFAIKDAFGETLVGGAGHLFMRDPNSHLLGVIGGYTDLGNANAAWGGGEAEFYLDNISLELAAGYMHVNPDFGSSNDELFAFADVAFYPVDNLRLALGASSVADFETAHVTAEYLLYAAPLSLKAELRAGEDDFVSGTVGVSFYFGGDDSSKSLIRRHREDDPRNRVLDIFAAGAAFAGLVLTEEEEPDPCDVEFPDPEICGPPDE